MKKTVLLFFILFICGGAFAQQAKIDAAWESFYKNNPADAIKKFKEATSDASTAEEAYVALTLIQADEGQSLEAMQSFQEFYKISKNPYPYMDVLWYTASVSYGYGKKSKERLKFLNTLLEDKNLPGHLKARIHSILGGHYETLGKFKDARKEYAQIGSITNWMMAGEFENISASGFDKNYDPITNPSVNAKFKNKTGAPVMWFTIKDARMDRWVDNTYYFYAGNAVVYAQNFIKSPTKQKVQLRLGVSGSLKVWLNDNLVLSEIEERDNGLDSYIVETTLNEGYNRILIQVAESEVDNSNFMLRITDENGENIQGLTIDDKQDKNYDKSAVEYKQLTPLAVDYFEKQVQENPTFINHLLLAKAYSGLNMNLQARKTLIKAEAMAPTCSYIQFKLINVYQNEGNRTAVAKAIEWLKDNDKENAVSIGLLFDEAVENENYVKADSLLTLLVKKYGNSEDIYGKKIQIYGAQDKNEELINTIDEAYKAYPENFTFVFYKVLLEKSKKNNAGSIKVWKKYMKKTYSVSAMKQLASLYFENSMLQQGLDLYETIIENNPLAISVYYDLADIYIQLRNYDKAITLINKCIEIAPYIGRYYSLRAKCYAENGNKTQAKADYMRAIELTPTNFDARKKLRELQGEGEDIFASFEQPDVYKAFKESGSAKDYPDDNSAILINSVQRVVYADGVSEEKHILVAKVFNAAGIDDWKEYSIGYYGTQRVNIEKVEVLKANGSKLEAERSGGDIVFTNLEAGDGVHITYKVENYQSGKLAPHFTDKHYFDLFYPVKYSSYSLLIHPDVKFKHKFAHGGFNPEKTTKNGYDMYVWKKENVAALKSESFMTPIVDFGEVLQLSTFPDWKFISNWYSDLARNKAKSDFEVKEIAQEIFKDKEGLSKLDKAKLIHNYIVENIRYSSVSFRQSGLIPQKASKVINTRVGDCKDVSTLFVALCREAGIDSVRLVLIDTRDNGKNDLSLPSIDFNHCIANITIDGKPYFVELTSDKNGFHSFPNTLKNAYALRIYDESETASEEPFYLATPTKVSDNIVRASTASFSGKEMVVDVKSVKTGDWAAAMRYTYADIPESERKKKLLQSLSNDNASAKLNTFSFTGLEDISDSLHYYYNYNMGNAVTQITGLNIFSMPWSDKITSIGFMSNEERKFPINFWDYLEFDKVSETVTISFPDGKKLAELPKNASYSCAAADYKVTYKLVGNNLEAKREMIVKKDIIDPASYAELKKFFESVVEEDTRQLAFK